MKKESRLIIFCSIVALIFGSIFFCFFLPKDSYSIAPISTNHLEQTTASHSLLPIISNQWYSTLFHSFPSSPLYALPLVYKATPQGLGFSYPTITTTKDAITAPYTQDFTVGYESPFTNVSVKAITDWSVSAEMKSSTNNTLSFFIGHGFPFSIVYPQQENTIISFADTVAVSENTTPITSNNFTTDTFMATIHNASYIFVFPKPVTIEKQKNTLIISNPDRIFIGLLDNPSHYNVFKETGNIQIMDTQVNPTISDDKLTTTYQITTDTTQPTLIALYPHQFDFLSSQQNVLGQYQTIRGPLKLVQTNSFTTTMPLITPPGSFAKLTKDYPDIKQAITKDTNDILTAPPPNSQDYYLGVWFGKISNLILLADSFGMDKEKNALLQMAEPLFLKSLDNFSYNNEKTSMIANNPEFGNENLNDHHFHYGYYIRTAAVLSSFDLSFLPKIQKPIDNLTNDIVTIQRDATDYPFLRNFDVYEGHSWADGVGDTDFGNNQESSSEAIQAWYGVYLWATISNNPNLKNYALYLYNTEITSAKYYWFDIKNMYGSKYQHSIASLVWGGKVEFNSWFSKDPNMKYGIELLPITPASSYLGTFSSFSPYETDLTQSGGDEKGQWNDLFLMWKSFYAPTDVIKEEENVKNIQDGNSKSLFLYTIAKNAEDAASKEQ